MITIRYSGIGSSDNITIVFLLINMNYEVVIVHLSTISVPFLAAIIKITPLSLT